MIISRKKLRIRLSARIVSRNVRFLLSRRRADPSIALAKVPCYLKDVEDVCYIVLVQVCRSVPVWVARVATEGLCYDEYV